MGEECLNFWSSVNIITSIVRLHLIDSWAKGDLRITHEHHYRQVMLYI